MQRGTEGQDSTSTVCDPPPVGHSKEAITSAYFLYTVDAVVHLSLFVFFFITIDFVCLYNNNNKYFILRG